MQKSYVTVNSNDLISDINKNTILKLNKNSKNLKSKLIVLSNNELKSISILKYQNNRDKFILLSENDFISMINRMVV